jgi:hypothetical protein
MSVSRRQIRWLGLSSALGGVLLAASTLVDEVLGNPGRVYTSDTSWHLEGPMAIIGPLVGVLMMALFIGGTVGLYVANRHLAGKAAKAGFMLLAAAFASTIAGFAISLVLPLDGGIAILFNALVVPPWVVMMPLGFLLVGLGLPKPIRRVPLVLGVILTARTVIGVVAAALSTWWPAARIVSRSDSPLGIATNVLLGLALAAIGFSMWSGGGMDRSPASSEPAVSP